MATEEDQLANTVKSFLRENFPQIQMHGGDSEVIEANPEEGFVRINLIGECTSCGLSPMTVNAIERKVSEEVDGISNVTVTVGETENRY